MSAERFAFVIASYPLAQDRDGTRPYGDYAGASAGDRVRLAPGPGGQMQATTELATMFESAEPLRQQVVLRETAEGWKFRSFGHWFPAN